MKNRYRRIPLELTLSPKYEGLTAHAKLAYLTLIVSPRQTPPGIYDGSMKSLEYETALSNNRLEVALKELEQAGLVEPMSSGGWWVIDTFRAQCCNSDYMKAATRHLAEKWPTILPKFLEINNSTLKNYEVNGKPKALPQIDHRPPSHPPQSSTGSGAVTGSDTKPVTDYTGSNTGRWDKRDTNKGGGSKYDGLGETFKV